MSTSESKDQKKEKKAIGVFPRLSLSKTMELVNAIYELGEGEPVRRRTVFDKLGRSAESGSSRVLITASGGGYGLTTGGYQAEYLGITDRGKQIVLTSDPLTKFKAIFETLFSNEIFSAFVARFNDKGIPIDEIAIEYLKSNHGLTLVDAKACWSVFKENLLEQNLTQEFSGKRVVISLNAALEQIEKSAGIKTEEIPPNAKVDSNDVEAFTDRIVTNSRKMPRQEDHVVPQIHFNIQVIIPENASPEKYDAIFKSIATHLLRRAEE